MAFLGDIGVLRVGSRRRARWWLWSSRFWMLGVVGEGGRLWREGVLARQGGDVVGASEGLEGLAVEGEGEREGLAKEVGEGGVQAVGEKEEKIQRTQASKRWWRQVVANAAWAPLTVHWSVEGGVLGEGAVGALGMVAGGVALREAWRWG